MTPVLIEVPISSEVGGLSSLASHEQCGEVEVDGGIAKAQREVGQSARRRLLRIGLGNDLRQKNITDECVGPKKAKVSRARPL